ncbi:MAG: hypothetical protein WC631_00535 [Candidatus Paceibacterota bacterium]|jgi:hypothetical protein
MIEIITTSFFVFSSLYGSASTIVADNVSTSPRGVLAPIEEKTEINIPDNEGLRNKVQKLFAEDPLLIDIARCESHFRQYDKDGSVLRGKVNKSDVGVMQINLYYHADKAGKLGYDLMTPEGNMAYAKYLYNREGVQPWISSSACWNDNTAAIPSNQIALIK